MTIPFVSELRTTDDIIKVGNAEGDILHLRAQVAELWTALRIDASESTPVDAVKRAAISQFFPDGESSDDFVVKLRGFEILDEGVTLAASGVRDGSTLLISRRRRRPVK
jgi:hypothetical protein